VEPQVTVIVPCYNYGRYVGQALDSVLNQSFRCLEVIAVDDASTDDSADVLRTYEHDPRVTVVCHETNRGHISTFNEAIELSRGELITLLSADDYCLKPTAIERIVSVFTQHPRVGMVYSAYAVVEEDGTTTYMRAGDHDRTRSGPDEFRDLMWGNYILHSGSFLRRTVQEELGPYDSRLTQAGDWDMWLRAMAAGYEAGYLAEPLWAYRLHGSNMQEKGMSPVEQIRQNSLVLERAMAALPPDAPADITEQGKGAARHAVLQTVYFDMFKGGRKRAWRGMIGSVKTYPSVLLGSEYYKALARLVIVTLGAHRWYRRMA
jgi:glycosyltransferase involved in cell wall biosynthesis